VAWVWADAPRWASGLALDGAAGEVTFDLHFVSRAPDEQGRLNVWVLTEDGLRHVTQGALIEELNLAHGAPVRSLAGTTHLRTRLRVADEVSYMVVVTNDLGREASYTLTVAGARLIDEQGQTNEAKAAALEVAVDW
jgi:hypothetical protein